MNMKKILLFIVLSNIFLGNWTHAQMSDDGIVTSHLAINVRQEKFVSFINDFKSGIGKVKNGELTSAGAVSNYYGVDVNIFPRVEQLLEDPDKTNSAKDYSNQFLEQLSMALNQSNNETNSVMDIRNAFASMAISSSLSIKESEALAMIDICTQELVRNYALPGLGGNSTGFIVSPFSDNGLTDKSDFSISSGDLHSENLPAVKGLPRWVRCGLGTIGSAILGGFQGFLAGIRFGQLGGAIGGISGVIAGSFSGAAKYCAD